MDMQLLEAFVLFIALTGGVSGLVRWLVKHYFSELKNNGGTSIKDKVDSAEKKLEKLEDRVDSIYELLITKLK
jgi:uncharacterized protein Yka (UPF0111/DUF47 family)